KVDRRADLFAAGVVLWEALTRKRLFAADDPGSVVSMVLHAPISRPSAHNPAVSRATDAVVLRALDRDPDRRYQTASELAAALEESVDPVTARRLGAWVAETASAVLAERAAVRARVETFSLLSDDASPLPPETPEPRMVTPATSALIPTPRDQAV